MHHHTAAQLAEIRRQQLTAEATYHRHVQRARRNHRNGPRSGPRRPLAAFHAWLATGQL